MRADSKKKNILKLVFLALFLLVPNFLRAQPIDLKVSPAIISFDASPGSRQNFSVEIKNNSGEKMDFAVEADDYKLGEENELLFLDGDNPENGLRKWIEIREERFSLEAGGQKKIEFVLSVPADAAAGSHYGSVMVRTVSEAGGGINGPVIIGKAGAHVLVNIKGEARGSGKMNSFELARFVWKKNEFKSQFENTGSIHYVPHGEIAIRNLLARSSAVLDLEKHFVFPGKKFTFISSWDAASPFGAYTARAVFIDGEGNPQIISKVFFGWLFFPFIASLLFPVFWGIRRIRKKN